MPMSVGKLVGKAPFAALAASFMAVSPYAVGNDVREYETSEGRTVVISGHVRNQSSPQNFDGEGVSSRNYSGEGLKVYQTPKRLTESVGIKFTSVPSGSRLDEAREYSPSEVEKHLQPQVTRPESSRIDVPDFSLESLLKKFTGKGGVLPKISFQPSIPTQIRMQEEEFKRRNPLYMEEESSPYSWREGPLMSTASMPPNRAPNGNYSMPYLAFGSFGSQMSFDKLKLGNHEFSVSSAATDHENIVKSKVVTNQKHLIFEGKYWLDRPYDGVFLRYGIMPNNSMDKPAIFGAIGLAQPVMSIAGIDISMVGQFAPTLYRTSSKQTVPVPVPTAGIAANHEWFNFEYGKFIGADIKYIQGGLHLNIPLDANFNPVWPKPSSKSF